MPPGCAAASSTGRPDAMPAASPVTPAPRMKVRSLTETCGPYFVQPNLDMCVAPGNAGQQKR